jgi:gamma-glutamyltranspeptidase/glutathione hydrolase
MAVSSHGMVSSAHCRATKVGREILAHGGNAIDSAVATAFALGVCEPWASGLGGQTMMMIYHHETGRTVALDGASKAPLAVIPGSLQQKDVLHGHKATTVPTTPAVLEYARRTYGSMPLKQLIEPAIEIAHEGYEVGGLQHRLTMREFEQLKRGSAAKFFLKDGQYAYQPGSRLRQLVLANTLARISENGVEEFYKGRIARDTHEDMEEKKGLIRIDDLSRIPWPIEKTPISTSLCGSRVITLPPPGAGPALIDMIRILNRFPERSWDADTSEGALLLAGVIREAILNWRYRPFDKDFPSLVSDKDMLNPEYAKVVADRVRSGIRAVRNGGDTTHLSVMDRYGNAVSLTQSIEHAFGSCEASPKLGFLYNNYMRSFEFKNSLHSCYLRPNAVPWACMAPTMVFRGSQPEMVLGSPGSDRIASSILHVLLRLRRQSPYDAVAGPRLHCSSTGKVSLEISRMRDDIPVALTRRGFTLSPRAAYSFFLGCVQLVIRSDNKFIGVADPRREGTAGGPKK